MHPSIRPIGIGLLLGLLGLFFGVFWAMHLTLNHEKIHNDLMRSGKAAVEEKFVINSQPGTNVHVHGSPVHEGHEGHDNSQAASSASGHSAHSHEAQATSGHDHSTHEHGAQTDVSNPAHDHSAMNMADDAAVEKPSGHSHSGAHDNPEMAAAHERLAKGHVHAMSLGLLTIILSLLMAVINAPAKIKTFAAACLGTGGVFYPLAWILMGYRTTSLGINGAQESVKPIVAFSIPLVMIGIIICLYYVLKGVLSRH